MEPESNPQELKIVHKEPRAYKLTFDGTEDELLQNFFKRIKAQEGIVKYNLSSWSVFPTTLEESKNLAKKWAIEFSKNLTYKDYSISIYFHNSKKNIRFQIKKNIPLVKIPIIVIDGIEEHDILNEIENKLNDYKLVKFDLNNYEKYPTTKEECIELSKKWSNYFENKKNEEKIILYFNKQKIIKFQIFTNV
jgi:hypothetical protein